MVGNENEDVLGEKPLFTDEKGNIFFPQEESDYDLRRRIKKEKQEQIISLREGSLNLSEAQQSMLIPPTQTERTNIADANLRPDGTKKSRHNKTNR